MSVLSLRSARFERITVRLGATLGGCWTCVFQLQKPLNVILDWMFDFAILPQPSLVPMTDDHRTELALCAALAPLPFTDISTPVSSKVYALDASLSHQHAA